MKGWKKWITSPVVTVGAFVLAVGLLLFSSVGGASAALTYYSENYATRVRMYSIGVSLLENGKTVSWRNYNSESDGSWDENTGVLLQNMLPNGEAVKIGKEYKEELAVQNTGNINQYVRVTVYKYWTDANGNKLQTVSPNLINLRFTNLDNHWIIDQEASTKERTVLYYNKVLKTGETTPLFADCIKIDNAVAKKVTQETVTNDGYTTIKTKYDYDGLQFWVEANVDAVQEHNAQQAISSAWGRKITVNNNTLKLN